MWNLAKAVTWVVSPLGSALLLCLLAVFMDLAGRKDSARRTLYVGALWLWLWSTPAMSGWLASTMEVEPQPTSKLATDSSVQVAVVLGGAIATPSLEHPLPSLTDSSDRIWQAARMYRENRAALLLLSGGSDLSVALEPEAESMKALLMELGVPSDRLILESRSRNTRENARFSAAILKDMGVNTVLLVTSALHMKRAVMEFEAAGLHVHAVPVNATSPQRWGDVDAWLPHADALRQTAAAMKEWVGRLVAAARSTG